MLTALLEASLHLVGPENVIAADQYESKIESLVETDLKDRHVLAAAGVAGAQYLVTENLADFPDEEAARLGVSMIAPDELGVRIVNTDPVRACAHIQREPPERITRYLQALSAELPRTGESIAEHLSEL